MKTTGRSDAGLGSHVLLPGQLSLDKQQVFLKVTVDVYYIA